MPCESCNVQFNVFKKKRPCTECRRLYCGQCLVRRNDRNLCKRCFVLTARPLSKVDLQKLKPKDLIFYLQSKHISTAGCVEKDELVNLVIAHAATEDGVGRDKSGTEGSENCSNPFDQIKQTCQNLFNSFTEKISNDLGLEIKNSTASNSAHNISTQPRPTSRELPTFSSSINRAKNRTNQNDNTVPKTSSTFYVNDDGNFHQTHSVSSSTNSPTSPSKSFGSSPSVSPKPKASRVDNKHTSADAVFSNSLNNLGNTCLNKKTRSDHLYGSSLNENVTIGCDCSDDELINAFHKEYESSLKQHVKKCDSPATRSDTTVEEQIPGPSGSVPSSTHHSKSSNDNRRSSDESSNSSFEELGAVGGGVNGASDNEHWQVINKIETTNSVANRIRSGEVLTNESFPSTSNSDEANSEAFPEHSNSNGAGRHDEDSKSGAHRVQRSKSESSVVRRSSCHKCGKSKKNLKQYVSKFRKQLESAQMPEADIKQEVQAFLVFLEKRSAESFEESESESNETETCLISVEGQIPSSTPAANPVTPRMHVTRNMDDDGIHIYAHNSDDNVVDTNSNNRFINLGCFTSSSDLEELSVKQLKEILMLNRIDYKGCCEKTELLERVYRLWKDLQTSPAVDKLPTDDLCKICMDAPIECVILECGHMATCTNCGKVLSECPICRQYIVRVVRFFRA